MSTTDSPSLSLTAAIAAYLDWHALRGTTPHHRGELRRMLLQFAAVAGADRPAGAVTAAECAAFLRDIQELGRKPNTVRAYYRTLHALYHWLVREEYLARSPMDRVPTPKAHQEQIQPLTREELTQLLAQPDRTTYVGCRDRFFIALLADTGLRLAEALGIRMGDIDFRARSISVMGKGRKPRTVFYGESVAGMLRDYLKRRGEGEADEQLFRNSLDEPLTSFTLSHRVRAYGEAAGIRGKRVSPHTLRHTFAVFWLLGGGDALSLQRLLGHSTPVMTSRYVNFTSGDLGRLHRTVSPLDRVQGHPAASPRGGEPGRKRRR